MGTVLTGDGDTAGQGYVHIVFCHWPHQIIRALLIKLNLKQISQGYH